MDLYQERVKAIMEALPYIKKFSGSTIVIKYGGHAMDDPLLKEKVILDFILLKLVGIKCIVVHGGGPHITDLMKKMGKEAIFLDGHRVTDSETMDITEMVLSGHLNKEIVALINANGGKAVGLSGRDSNLIIARKKADPSGKGLDFGQVGEIEKVDPQLLISLTDAGFIPVISPVGGSHDGKAYNVNADVAAGYIAAELRARRLIYMTDVKGIYSNFPEESSFMESIREKEIENLKSIGKITKGMLPKIDSALLALKKGVEKVHIIDGRVEHALLMELFTEAGVGSEIKL